MNSTKSISIFFIKVILLFIFCPSYFFPPSHPPILLYFHPPFLSSFHPLYPSLPSFILSFSPFLSHLTLSLTYICIYIFFRNYLRIDYIYYAPLLLNTSVMYLLKTRTFSYIITVQLATSRHLILDY